jgi:hypothetical protein
MVVDPAPTPETHLTHGFHVMQRNPAGSYQKRAFINKYLQMTPKGESQSNSLLTIAICGHR